MANIYNQPYSPVYGAPTMPQNMNIGNQQQYLTQNNSTPFYAPIGGNTNDMNNMQPQNNMMNRGLFNLGNQYPTIQQQQAFQNSENNLHIVPVTCYEEAIAFKIPLDGSITYFIDVSHNRIYSKQLNFNDGSCLFKTYVLETPTQQQAQQNASPVPAPVSAPAEQQQQLPTKNYVERQEFDQLQLLVNQLLDKKTDKPDKAEPADTQTVKTSKGGK